MIFAGKYNGRNHFDMVLGGEKTQTRRITDRYQVNKSYAIQPCRTCKGVRGKRLMIDAKWWECCGDISQADAIAEGGYAPEEYEKVFVGLFPNQKINRCVYQFHVIDVEEND